MGKCENCGNDREEYLNHYCKMCLDKMIENNSDKTETKVSSYEEKTSKES